MGIRPVLVALAALAASGCASSDYGYAYCYDPWRGPVGYRYGPLEPAPPCAAQAPPAGVFLARDGGWRGPYVSGPHPTPVAEAAVEAVSREAAR